MRSRYADQIGLEHGASGTPSLLVEVLAIAGGIVLLFAPFAVWQEIVVRRAPRTPDRDVAEGCSSTAVVDVCSAADEARSRGRRYLAVQIGIFAACATIAILDSRLFAIFFAAAPLSWLLARRLRERTRRAAASDPQVRPLTSGVIRIQVLALYGVALWLTAIAWGASWLSVIAVPWFVHDAVIGAATFAGYDARDIVPAGLDLVALSFTLVVLLIGCASLGRFARRLRGIAADRDQRRRPRPVLLYLRAFDDDPRVLAAGDFGRRPATEIFSFRARVPYEEVIARELDRQGRVVTIAEPGSPMLFLPLGAGRERLSDAEWQTEVSTRMGVAARIVIALGTTRGLLWEIADVTRQGLLDNVLLIFPPCDADDLRARWRASAETIAATGGPALDLPVDAASVLAVEIAATGVQRVVVADRRDEYTYAAAIAACSLPNGSDPPDGNARTPEESLTPTPGSHAAAPAHGTTPVSVASRIERQPPRRKTFDQRRELFERAIGVEAATGDGLSLLRVTFRRWLSAVTRIASYI